MADRVRDAARMVVQAWALKHSMQGPVENLRRELALDGDRGDLARAINARRATDNNDRMRAFRATFDELLDKLIDSVAGGNEEGRAALTDHVFGPHS